MTPTAGSNLSRYKIPDVINPSGVCCICVPVPDSREYRAQFMGAVWRMSLQTHYERDEAHSAQLVAAKWRKIWEDLTVAGCCGDEIRDVTINTSINVQNQLLIDQLMQIYTLALFDIDVAFPLTPDDFDSDPGDAGGEVAQRTRALCLACDSWINEVCNRGLSWIEGQKEEISALIAAGVALPFIPVYAVIGAFVGIGVLAGTVINQLAEDEYRRYLACALFTALTGEDSNDPDAFHGALDSPPVRPPPPQNPLEDAARDLIEAWIRVQLASIDNYLGFIKLLNAAMGAADVLTDEDCSCTGTWEHIFDFTVSDGGWASVVGLAGYSSFYTPGVGWQRVGGLGASLGIQFVLLEDGQFTGVAHTCSGAPTGAKNMWSSVLGSGVKTCGTTAGSGCECIDTACEFDCFVDVPALGLVALVDSTFAGGTRTLSKLRFTGTGFNPFL